MQPRARTLPPRSLILRDLAYVLLLIRAVFQIASLKALYTLEHAKGLKS